MSHRHGSFTQMCLTSFVATGLALAVAASAYAQAPVVPPGSGTSQAPYLVSEIGHLVWMGDTAAASSGKYYSLTTDIDASATAGWNDADTDTDVLEGFKPIGTWSNLDTTSFRGIFNGGQHTISGLIINRPGAAYVGLFGRVGVGGQVRNLGLVGGAVTGNHRVGGLLGLNAGTVSNCYATGTVTGNWYVGGLVGQNNSGPVSNCYATGVVRGTSSVGGLVGLNLQGTVSDCYATGAVPGDSYYVGGLVGWNNSGTVSNCYATGAVTGEEYVGGLVGYNTSSGTVSNSYWDMQTSGQSTSDGGAGKTTAEMKQQATFVGWDFTSIWGIVEGDSYPYLRFSPPPFKLAVHASGPGSVTVDPPSVDGTYAPGTVVTLTAVPNGPNDVFIRWAGAAPVDSLTVSVVMDIHRSVTAVFPPRIEINSLADLARIGNEPAYPLTDIVYVLTTDIDASATAGWNDAGTDTDVLEGFKPIGTYSSSNTRSFRGIFDGNGHTISGLIINRPGADYVGLFGSVGSGGQVRNLGLVGGEVSGSDLVGGLVGVNASGTVSNCYATGAVSGTWYVGGLVGYSDHGTVSNCYATGAVSGTGTYVGGLVGYSRGTVSNCYATGVVTGTSSVGGLVGRNNSGTVSNSYWDMQTSGQSTSDGGAGKTTAEMKQQATFVGWDFTSIWGIVEGDSYPYLRFSPPPFKLAVHASGPGSVTVDPPSVDGTYAMGTVVTLTAVPNGPSDVLIRWAGAAPVDSLTVSVVMDIHRSVKAVFSPAIEVNSLADLARIGNEPDYPLAASYVLTADIDASATAGWNDADTDTDVLEGFKPIGTEGGAFSGVFEGNGHTISGLIINRPGATCVGLFRYVGSGGQVRNLGLVGGEVTGNQYVGGLVGYNSSGTVSNCYATGAVTGNQDVGGLVGYNSSGTVSNCYATGAVSGNQDVGGLVGVNSYGTVSNCYAAGAVTGTGNYVGGLVGYNPYGTVSNCYATGAVTGEEEVGGLVGRNSSGTVSNCHATGAVTGTGTYVGGLVGLNSSSPVSNCYATGAVTGDERVGGLVGSNYGTVSNCYATGAVTGTSSVGGLVGSNDQGTVSNSYWDMQTSGQSTSAGGAGKTTAEMKQQATFVGWDFTDIWGIEENVTYPFFLNEPQAPVLTVALSRKTHGSVGDFDIDLPIGSTLDAGLECRLGGPMQVVLTFDGPADGVAVQASAGNVDEVLVEGDQATVTLSGVPNATCLTLTVTAACQQGETEVYIRCLAGDATGDGTVNIFDLVQVRNQLNQAVSPLNFRADVNADGAINIFDLVNVRNHLNTSATCEPPAPEGGAPPADPARANPN